MEIKDLKLLSAPKEKRITIDEYFGIQREKRIKPEYVEFCTVYCAFAEELENKEIKVIIDKNLAIKIFRGKATVDALDPLFITLRPEVKDFIKSVVRAHIDKIKNDFFKRM